MPVYKYTMKKYVMTWSTWVIIGITFVLTFILGGWLPFQFFNPSDPSASSDYMAVSAGLISGITAFLATFTSIFAGFKSAQMFKDEVEDGTFLLLLSKPIPRRTIIFQKWLALQTIMLLYTFITAATVMFGMIIFDEGNHVPQLETFGVDTLRSRSVLIGLIIWAVLSLFGLIFSSISLLVSTRTSTGTTIGISIAIGVVIPMTSMVSYFTKKPEIISLKNPNFESFRAQMEGLKSQYFANQSDIDSSIQDAIANYPDLPDEVYTFSPEDFITSTIDEFREFYNYSLSNQGLDNVGILSGKTDAYSGAWVADLNFQVQQLASMATDVAIPKDTQYISEGLLAGTPFSSTHNKSVGALEDVYNNETSNNYLDQMIEDTLIEIEDFNTATHIIFLATNAYLVNNFSDANKKSLEQFKFTINTHTFNEINKYIFEYSNTIWSASTNVNHDFTKDTIKLTFAEVQELINAMIITELNYYNLNQNTSYGELVNNMNENWITYKNDANAEALEKQSYLIPEIGRLLAVDYRNAFINFYMSNLTKNDKSVESYIYTLYFTHASTEPLSTLFFSSDNLLNTPFLKNLTITILPGYNYENQDPTGEYDYMFNDLNLVGNDLVVYNTLKSIDEAGVLVKFERVPYANKYGILGFYLGLALILVPMSYMLIRKQDYR